MSTLQAISDDVSKQQQAAALWVPNATTANLVTYAATSSFQPRPAAPAKPKSRLKPLEWLDAQVNEVLALAIP